MTDLSSQPERPSVDASLTPAVTSQQPTLPTTMQSAPTSSAPQKSSSKVLIGILVVLVLVWFYQNGAKKSSSSDLESDQEFKITDTEERVTPTVTASSKPAKVMESDIPSSKNDTTTDRAWSAFTSSVTSADFLPLTAANRGKFHPKGTSSVPAVLSTDQNSMKVYNEGI
jgi:hypothetical protein